MKITTTKKLCRSVVSGISSTALGYQSCVQSREWFVSQSNIRCSAAFSMTGFAPDPKDCSKYYACDSYVGPDGMSNGKKKKSSNR